MTTIDILIPLAADRIGCPIAQHPIVDSDEPRTVTVTSRTGTDTDVQIHSKATLEQVIALLLAAYTST